MDILLAILIGGLFGFVLDKVSANNPNKIINMLRLKDLYLMKVILGAIGIASVGLFGGISLGIIDAGHLSVKSAYIGVIAGGGILGIGFALSGYCPGTGLTALASGRKDAIFFALGGLVGAFLFMKNYAFLKETFLFSKIGDKATLGLVEGSNFPAVFETINGSVLGIILGVILIITAYILPEK